MPGWLSWLADWWNWCFDVFVWHPGGEDVFVITLIGHVLGIVLFVIMTVAAAWFLVTLAIGAVIMVADAFRRIRATLFPY
jgi:uncharacterized membrane protein